MSGKSTTVKVHTGEKTIAFSVDNSPEIIVSFHLVETGWMVDNVTAYDYDQTKTRSLSIDGEEAFERLAGMTAEEAARIAEVIA